MKSELKKPLPTNSKKPLTSDLLEKLLTIHSSPYPIYSALTTSQSTMLSLMAAHIGLFDNLVRCHHGNTVRTKGGQTVTAMLNSGTTSHEIVGHIHRREFASRRIPAGGGFKTVNAMSPGCFCRVDTEISIVPAFAGKPVDWQHGMGIVYKYGDKVSMHLIPIDDGSVLRRWGKIRWVRPAEGDGSTA